MPNFDGTGPNGEGPMTGRVCGKCADKPAKTPANTQRGRGARGRCLRANLSNK